MLSSYADIFFYKLGHDTFLFQTGIMIGFNTPANSQ